MRVVICVVLALAAASPLDAQQTAAGQPASAGAPPQAADSYVYQTDGRRDPFKSLVNGGTDVKNALKRDGLRTFSLSEVSVRGIMRGPKQLVAMVQGPDNRTYLVHQGDKLADAVVKNVTADGLIAMQDITDPLSTQKQREVRKLLRSLEGASN